MRRLGYEMFEMWDFRYMGCSRCEVIEMWCVLDVGCMRCVMFGM